MPPDTLSLDPLVDVQIRVSPLAAPRISFDQALIMGISTHISTATRVEKYSQADDMLGDGFLITDPEYLAAQIYFAQTPRPQYVWIGRQESGVESCVQGLTACRESSSEWYVCIALPAVEADHLACALWAETVAPTTVYAGTTADADVLNGVAGNVCEDLKGAGYKRTIMQYSTKSAYAICAIIGYAMGQNTGLANSAFTLKFKQEIGITTETISVTDQGTVEGLNCNLYLSYANYYNIFEQGVMANGQFFDEIINLDMLKNKIQLNIMDLLYGNPKVPQTNAGVNQLIHKINEACDEMVDIGFLGDGSWTGTPVLNLNTGDPLPKGYLVQATALSAQSTADRQARKAPNIYVAVKEAGAVHSILIGVYVDR